MGEGLGWGCRARDGDVRAVGARADQGFGRFGCTHTPNPALSPIEGERRVLNSPSPYPFRSARTAAGVTAWRWPPTVGAVGSGCCASTGPTACAQRFSHGESASITTP